ncbi:hypothetical protein LTR53_015270 [Teratosphaeriaceae sp. CCFEE 6253]|nr:hypothetical protein LTR53_015270 [Teratosphaeriaceae sp. CCFEE 6253]
MRSSIDRHPDRIKNILTAPNVRGSFLSDASKGVPGVVKAFVETNAENALKTKPKGYAADHKDIELLRLRNYAVRRKLTDKEVLGSDGLDQVAGLFAHMRPFITYLNSVIMPDDGTSEEEDEPGSDSPSGDEDE